MHCPACNNNIVKGHEECPACDLDLQKYYSSMQKEFQKGVRYYENEELQEALEIFQKLSLLQDPNHRDISTKASEIVSMIESKTRQGDLENDLEKFLARNDQSEFSEVRENEKMNHLFTGQDAGFLLLAAVIALVLLIVSFFLPLIVNVVLFPSALICLIALVAEPINNYDLSKKSRSEVEKIWKLRKDHDEQKKQEYTLRQGSLNPNMICPHCGLVNSVRTKRVEKKSGISGGKAAVGMMTGGVSLLATGISGKEKKTRAYCSSCKNSWEF